MLRVNTKQIALLNKILLIIAILSFFWLAGEIATYFLSTTEISANYTQTPSTPIITPSLSPHSPLNDFSFYDCVKEGRLFRLPARFLTKPEEVDVPKVNFVLEGIVWGRENAVAILRGPGSRETFLVRVGEVLNDLKIVKITQNSVILKKDGRRVVLRLEIP